MTYDLNDVLGVNDECIGKSSVRVIQFFNITFLSRYPLTLKGVFDNGSEFKRDFNPLLKGFDI